MVVLPKKLVKPLVRPGSKQTKPGGAVKKVRPEGPACVACEGTGTSSRGERCLPCHGTGTNPGYKDTCDKCGQPAKVHHYNGKEHKAENYCSRCNEHVFIPRHQERVGRVPKKEDGKARTRGTNK
jgi:hypothetical protein